MCTCIPAALMRNTGMLFANDPNVERAKAIVGNIHRMGVTNTVVSDYDGRQYPEVKIHYTTFCSRLFTRRLKLFRFRALQCKLRILHECQ